MHLFGLPLTFLLFLQWARAPTRKRWRGSRCVAWLRPRADPAVELTGGDDSLFAHKYCNGTGNTYWANLRRKNTGRDEPHNVKLWGLGNEMHGAWQVGALSATDYTKKAYRWAHGLRLVDPSIKLVGCGNQVRRWLPCRPLLRHRRLTRNSPPLPAPRATRSGTARFCRA